MLGQLLLPEIEELVRERQFRQLKEIVSELPAADLAELISDLEESDLVVVFRLLSKDLATEVFEYLEFPEQQKLLESLRSETLRHILEEMSADDRTALLEELPPKAASQLMMMLSPEERKVAQTLLNYPEDSVGRLMTPEFIYLRPSMTAEDALAKIRRLGIDRETVYALYVIDDARKLVGVVGLRTLVTAPLDATIEDLMESQVVSVHADVDQEEAAETLKHYDLIALPIVDRDDRLIGIVTFDDLMDIIEREHNEDVQLQAAVLPSEEPYLNIKWYNLVRRRVVWLIPLLIAETVGVIVLTQHEEFLERFILLVMFVPVMIATGGNTGTQTAALVIRAIATGEVEQKDAWRLLSREFAITASLAVILAMCIFPLAMFIRWEPMIAICISAGIAVIVTMANIFGTMLPLLLKRMKLDPALMSGPFIATAMDVAGLFIYVELCMLILANYNP